MSLVKIAPLGERPGVCTFETVWDLKYANVEEAIAANDYVGLDFAKDEAGVVYIVIYHTKMHEDEPVHIMPLGWQNFIPALGIDTRDDTAAMEIAQGLLEKYKL